MILRTLSLASVLLLVPSLQALPLNVRCWSVRETPVSRVAGNHRFVLTQKCAVPASSGAQDFISTLEQWVKKKAVSSRVVSINEKYPGRSGLSGLKMDIKTQRKGSSGTMKTESDVFIATSKTSAASAYTMRSRKVKGTGRLSHTRKIIDEVLVQPHQQYGAVVTFSQTIDIRKPWGVPTGYFQRRAQKKMRENFPKFVDEHAKVIQRALNG